MEYQHILVTYDPPVGILQINRPKALSALNAPLKKEMAHAPQDYGCGSCHSLHGYYGK
jgi:enoyl-CoA hydratase/carnithine racemase